MGRAALGRHRPTRWLGEVKRLAKTHTATTVSREGGAAFESEEPWYASFVVHDAATCAATLRRLPRNGVGMRGVPGVAESEAHHGSHAWIFVGDNSMGTEPLDGRPERPLNPVKSIRLARGAGEGELGQQLGECA